MPRLRPLCPSHPPVVCPAVYPAVYPAIYPTVYPAIYTAIYHAVYRDVMANACNLAPRSMPCDAGVYWNAEPGTVIIATRTRSHTSPHITAML